MATTPAPVIHARGGSSKPGHWRLRTKMILLLLLLSQIPLIVVAGFTIFAARRALLTQASVNMLGVGSEVAREIDNQLLAWREDIASASQLPEIIAYAVHTVGGLLARCDVMTRLLPAGRDFPAAWLTASSPAHRGAIIEAVAKLLRSLSALGAHHPDLNVKNIYIAGDGLAVDRRDDDVGVVGSEHGDAVPRRRGRREVPSDRRAVPDLRGRGRARRLDQGDELAQLALDPCERDTRTHVDAVLAQPQLRLRLAVEHRRRLEFDGSQAGIRRIRFAHQGDFHQDLI